MKKFLGIVLGLLLGPFSTFIFGFKLFAVVVAIQLVVIAVLLFMDFQIWQPLWLIANIFFAYHNFKLSSMTGKSSGLLKDERRALEEEYIGIVAIQYSQLLAVLAFLTSVGEIFKAEKWVRGIIWTVIGLPLTLFIVQWAMGIAMIPIMAILAIKPKKKSKQKLPKEVGEAIDTIDEIRADLEISENTALDRVEGILREDVKKSAAVLKESANAKQWVYSTVADIAGDNVESGEHHLYRGVLNPNGPGPDYLKIYKYCLKKLAAIGAIEESKADEETNALLANMKTVG